MSPVELDAIDRKILEELTADARLPVATLAQRVHLSRHAVRHRLDRLEALKVIAGYTLRLGEGPPKKPTTRAIIRVYRKDRMRGTEVTEAITRIPEVTYCYVVSGDSDLIVHIEAESQDRVNAIWSHLSNLPGVADTNTAFVLSSVVDRRRG
jgi:Lrp/AsnC family transcriptional regulator, leucine-responsive regulatory protein